MAYELARKCPEMSEEEIIEGIYKPLQKHFSKLDAVDGTTTWFANFKTGVNTGRIRQQFEFD